MDKNLPLISIIVPSYNEEKHIARCLDSIIGGTYQNFEIICVDDNSTDSTFKIISDYAEKDSRVTALKNPEKGVSSARNFGMEKAVGDYIGFVDSDDFIQPQMYEFLLKAIEENECKMAVCRYSKTSEFVTETFDYKCRECDCGEFIDFYDAGFVSDNELTVTSACMKLVKADFIKNFSFNSYAIGEDTVFCSELWTNTEKVYLVDAPLYCYFVNTNSVSYTKIWDKKWFDLIETRFISYENFKKYKTDKISAFYLERGMKLLLSYRFNIKNSENEKVFKKPIKKYFRKYIMSYLRCTSVSLKNKLSVTVFYYFPPLYTAFRKMGDSTL